MKKILLPVVFVLISIMSYAQNADEMFGKNRIQYKHFDWFYFSSTNFDVHYYGDGDDLAREVAKYMEDQYDRITELIGFPTYSKTKIFIYNSVADLHQSNVGVNESVFTLGGQTDFVKSYVEIAHPGTLTELKQKLLLEVSRLLIHDMMFGGNLSDMWQNSYLLSLPEWFTEGAAQYIASGWSIEMDDYVRELVGSKKANKFTKLKGKDARLAGQSLWNYLAQQYGPSNINQILNLTRVTRNEEKSIRHTLGIPFEQLMQSWKLYYSNMAAQTDTDYVRADNAQLAIKRNKKTTVFNSVNLSPNGSSLAYVSNLNGRYQIVTVDLATGESSVVSRGGMKSVSREVDYQLPILNWADNETLGYINVENGVYVLWMYDMETKAKIPSALVALDQVKSFDFSGNGRLAILSAERDGKNDLYLLSVRRNRLRRLTNDHFDDIHPSFVPETNTIVFSSNRSSDSLALDETKIEQLSNNYNLFLFNLDTTKAVLNRITNTVSRDVMPLMSHTSEVVYLSDQKGIMNLFKYDLESGIYQQLTNYRTSIINYDLNFVTGDLAAVISKDNLQQIYRISDFDLTKNNFTKQTFRQEIEQAKYFVEQRKLRQSKAKSNEPITLNFQTNKSDSTGQVSDSDLIDTDNYVFDQEVVESTRNRGSFLSQYRRIQTTLGSNLTGPFLYESRFSADNMVTSWIFDPLRGFGINLKAQMNDMLENHKFFGGVMSTTDFRSGDYFAEYQYLENQVDFSARYEGSVIYWNSDVAQRYVRNAFQVGASLPLSERSRFSFKPTVTTTRFDDLDYEQLILGASPNNRTALFGGATAEFVFDNSVVRDMNSIEGTRGKIEFSHYQGISSSENTFSKFTVDFRHYQKIHKELTWATKVNYGKFLGPNKPYFLLGGMDNWIFSKIAGSEEQNGPLAIVKNTENEHLLFNEFVTSVRGFDYAEFAGSDVLLVNTELRLPIIRYLSSGPISSSFFKNLQFVGFFDIGSAWKGKSPFNKNSTASDINGGPVAGFEWTIKNYRSPWLMGYGVGIRTVLLGYYMKFDYARPIENLEVQKGRLYLTLGYDF